MLSLLVCVSLPLLRVFGQFRGDESYIHGERLAGCILEKGGGGSRVVGGGGGGSGWGIS